MAFGEHLDELRTRLLRSIAALLLGVVPLMFFKREVTEIYIAPYRKCWVMQYRKFLDRQDQKVGLTKPRAELTAGEEQELQARLAKLHKDERRVIEWNLERRDEILTDKYPTDLTDQIQTQGGFPIAYNLKATGGLDDIWIFMSATLLFGLILASPFVLWQVWAFIAAGLYANERRVVWTYVPFALGLLAFGVLFGYFLAVPYGYYMLIDYMNLDLVGPMFTVSHYFTFFFSFCTALGLVFQLPMVMLALCRLGIVSHAAMRKNWRYVVLGIFGVALLVTPPDPFSMGLLAAPMIALYGLGLLLTAFVERSTERPQAAGANA